LSTPVAFCTSILAVRGQKHRAAAWTALVVSSLEILFLAGIVMLTVFMIVMQFS